MIVYVGSELLFDFCIKLACEMLVHDSLDCLRDQISDLIVFFVSGSEIPQELFLHPLQNHFLNSIELERPEQEFLVERLIFFFELDFGLILLFVRMINVRFV